MRSGGGLEHRHSLAVGNRPYPATGRGWKVNNEWRKPLRSRVKSGYPVSAHCRQGGSRRVGSPSHLSGRAEPHRLVRQAPPLFGTEAVPPEQVVTVGRFFTPTERTHLEWHRSTLRARRFSTIPFP